MVLITGVIKNTDGTPYMGSVKFALNDLGIESNTVYLPTVVTVESDGTFTVDLWPNTNSLTSSYYKCSLDNGSVFNISIPGNNPSYNLGDVILIDPGTLDSGILRRLNQIESGITTRVSDSDARLSDAREWVAQTAPIEVVSQPTNNTRYAWTPQRIWDTIVSWFSTITSDDIQEGSSNLYYTDSRVANNSAVQANTNKVSATGSVTTHSDITSAGSGQVITTPERTKLGNIEDNAQVNTVDSVVGKTGAIVLDSSDVGLGNVPNIDTTNANNISSGTLSGSRLSYGTVANTPAQGNDTRFTDSREWTASTVSQSVAQAGTDTTRHAWTSQRVRDNVSFYTQPYTSDEKSKLAGLNSADYLPVGGTAVNSQLLDNIDSSQFLRSDTNDTMTGSLTVFGTAELTTLSVNKIEKISSIVYKDSGSNFFLGEDSLINNTTGVANVAIGGSTLTNNTTGKANTAVGWFSLNANTEGFHNTAIGFNSLRSNIEGNLNSALGDNALSSNTSGSENLALGGSALRNNTTGNGNTAIGMSVLFNNISGDFNTAIGSGSLASNTTGESNTAIGRAALNKNTTGFNNLAFGKNALGFSEQGNSNTAIGSGAGLNCLGSNNIFLGYNAGQNEPGSNKLYISNSNTSNPLIFGDFSAQKLQVNGGLTITENLEIVGAIESGQVIAASGEFSGTVNIGGPASPLNARLTVIDNPQGPSGWNEVARITSSSTDDRPYITVGLDTNRGLILGSMQDVQTARVGAHGSGSYNLLFNQYGSTVTNDTNQSPSSAATAALMIYSNQAHHPLLKIKSGGSRNTDYLQIEGGDGDIILKLNSSGKLNIMRLNISNLPTSASGLSAGDVWDDSGTLKIA